MVALEALRGEVTVAQIAQKHGLHPSQIQAWKAEALGNLERLFEKGSGQRGERASADEAQLGILERKVGQLLIENDFLKKSWAGYVKRTGLK
jgi:transposase